MAIKSKLKELNLINFSKRTIASPTTVKYSTERRGIMGDAPKTTKLVQSKVDYAKDYVTFFFLTEATEKYGADHEYTDIMPKAQFAFERNPSELYEIQLRFFGIAKLQELITTPPAEGMKSLQAKPAAKYPTGGQVQPPPVEQPEKEIVPPEEEIPEEEPEPNATVNAITPGQATGEPNPDEEKIRYFHNQKEALQEAEPKNYTVYNMVKNWLWSTDFAVWSNAPSFHWQGFNYNMSTLGASIYPTNIEPEVWDKVHGDALIDKHLYDLFLHVPFFINQMASSLLNKIRAKKEDVVAIDKEINDKITPGQVDGGAGDLPIWEVVSKPDDIAPYTDLSMQKSFTWQLEHSESIKGNYTAYPIETDKFPDCDVIAYRWAIPDETTGIPTVHWWAISIHNDKDWSHVYYFKKAFSPEQAKQFVEKYGELPNLNPTPNWGTLPPEPSKSEPEEIDPNFDPFEGEELFKETAKKQKIIIPANKNKSSTPPPYPPEPEQTLAHMLLSVGLGNKKEWHSYAEKLLSDPQKFKTVKSWLEDQSLYYGLKEADANNISDFIPEKILYMAYSDYLMDYLSPDTEAYSYGYNHPWDFLKKAKPANLPKNPKDYWNEEDPDFWSDEQREEAGQIAEENAIDENTKEYFNHFDSYWSKDKSAVEQVYTLVLENFFNMEYYKEQTIEMVINFLILFMGNTSDLADALGKPPEPEEEPEPEEIDPNFNPFEGEEMFKEDIAHYKYKIGDHVVVLKNTTTPGIYAMDDMIGKTYTVAHSGVGTTIHGNEEEIVNLLPGNWYFFISDVAPSDAEPEPIAVKKEPEPEEIDPDFNPFEGEDMFKEHLQEKDEITVHHKNDGTVEIWRFSDMEAVQEPELVNLPGKNIARMKKDDILARITQSTNELRPVTKNALAPAFNKAALVAKDLSINPRYRGHDVTIYIGRDGAILKRKTADNTETGYKENVPASKIFWMNESTGFIFKWNEDKGEAAGWLFENSDSLASTLTEYNIKKDDFKWSFDPNGQELSWKDRSRISKTLVKEGKDTRFELEKGKSIERIIEGLNEYLGKAHPNVISFEIDLGEKEIARLLSRIVEKIQGDYTTVLATQKWESLSRLFLLKNNLYDSLFGPKKHLIEAEIIDPTLEPEEKEALVCAYGSFTPITNEHIVLLKKVVASAGQVKGSAMVFIKPSKEFAHDEISLKQKAQVIKEAVPEISVCMETGLFDIMDAFIWVYNRHYKEIYVITGSDEVVDINQIFEENNGKQTDAGFFDFKTHKVISYGKHNPDKSPEAQMARNALANGNFQTFMKAVAGPNLPYYTSIKKLFDILKYELKDRIGLGGI